MVTSLSKHPFFEPWADPESGAVSFLLNRRVAPVQQSFYFTNASLSADERWLWFLAAFPPSPNKMLAAVSMDPADPRIVSFPGSAGRRTSPCVAPEGDACYFCMDAAVWRQPIDGEPTLVCRLPEDYIAGRRLSRLATHLTISADGRYLLLDGQVGNQWFVAVGERRTGRVTVLKEFGRHYNHAQFSPVDPELFLIAQDWWIDAITGRRLPYDHRIWLMDVGQTMFSPLCPAEWYGHGKRPSHEWWSKDELL